MNQPVKVRPKFIITPSIVTFSNYQHSAQYRKKVLIVNNDTEPHQILIRYPNCTDELKFKATGSQKLSPGLSVAVTITFLPVISFDKQKFDRRFEISLSCKAVDYEDTIPIIRMS